THLDQSGTGADQIECRRSHQKTETGNGLAIFQLAGFQLETSRFVVQEVLLDVEAQTILVESFEVDWLVADNRPSLVLLSAVDVSQRQMKWAKPLRGQPDMAEETSLSRRWHQGSNCPLAVGGAVDMDGALDPNP